MRTRMVVSAVLTVFFLLPSAATAQSSSIGIEARAGVGLGSETLGFTTSVPQGQFNLADVTAAPMLGLGLVLPVVGPGIRPQLRVSYLLPVDVAGNWIPCDPGLACPDIYLPLDAQADRWQATVGAEFPLAASSLPLRPYVRVGVGLRRYGFSWKQIGAETDNFLLRAGSTGETDLMAGLGLGAAVSMGAFELSFEGAADLSSFGPGVVPIVDPVLPAGPGIDLGRRSMTEFTLSVGLRRYLD